MLNCFFENYHGQESEGDEIDHANQLVLPGRHNQDLVIGVRSNEETIAYWADLHSSIV